MDVMRIADRCFRPALQSMRTRMSWCILHETSMNWSDARCGDHTSSTMAWTPRRRCRTRHAKLEVLRAAGILAHSTCGKVSQTHWRRESHMAKRRFSVPSMGDETGSSTLPRHSALQNRTSGGGGVVGATLERQVNDVSEMSRRKRAAGAHVRLGWRALLVCVELKAVGVQALSERRACQREARHGGKMACTACDRPACKSQRFRRMRAILIRFWWPATFSRFAFPRTAAHRRYPERQSPRVVLIAALAAGAAMSEVPPEVLSPKAVLRGMEAFSTPGLDEKLLKNLQLTLHTLCPRVRRVYMTWALWG